MGRNTPIACCATSYWRSIDLRAWSLLALLLLWPHALVSSACGQEVWPKERIVAAVVDWEDAILESDSWYVDCEYTEHRDFHPSKYGRRTSGERVRMGRKGDKWYLFSYALPDPQDKRPHDRTFIYRDGVFAEFMGPTLWIAKQGATSTIYQWRLYTCHLFVNEFKYLPAASRVQQADEFTAPFFAERLQNDRRYQVDAKSHEVDGRRSFLIEIPGVDRIWVDPSLACAPIRRELFFGPDRPSQTLKTVHYYRDFVEAKRGLWLPTTIVIDFYPDPKFEEPSTWGKLTSQLTLKAHEVQFDRLNDSFFSLTVPEGTLVRDTIRDMEYVVDATSTEPFGSAVEFASVRLAARSRGQWRIWLMCGNAVLIGAFLAYYASRHLRRS